MTTKFLNIAIARALVAAVLITYCGLSELAQAQVQQSVPQETAPAGTDAQAAPAATTDPQPAPGPHVVAAPSAEAQPQTTRSTQTQEQPATTAQSSGENQQNNPPTGIVNPSEGPLTPVPPSQRESLPNAPSTAQQPPASSPQQNGTFQQPVGAAGAQVGPTAGGAASKPAGNAIAPAKQRQTRSFLIKLGAVAAAGVAIGTVVALSRGTSGNPPGTR